METSFRGLIFCLINVSICIKCPAILTFSSSRIPTFIFHCVRFYVRLEKIPGYCHYVPMAGTWNERNFKDLLEFSRKEMGKLCDQAYTKRLGITSRLFWQANKSPMWLVNMVILMFFSLCGWFKLLTDDDEWPRVKSCTEEYFPCTMTVFYDPESIFNIIPHRPDWIACLVSNLCKFEERSKLKETSLGFLNISGQGTGHLPSHWYFDWEKTGWFWCYYYACHRWGGLTQS